MIVHIRLFAMMAQTAGTGRIDLEFPNPPTVSVVRQTLRERFPAMPWPNGTMLALNQEYIGPGDPPLRHGDELAIIPPVSGG